MNNEIIVNISTEGEKTYIVFNFEQPIKLEITTDSKETIKNVFYEILNHIISDNYITFKFTRTGEDLYNDVTEKYIQDLNNELEALKNNFKNPVEESNKAWNNFKNWYNLFGWFNQSWEYNFSNISKVIAPLKIQTPFGVFFMVHSDGVLTNQSNIKTKLIIKTIKSILT